ncbi:MAG: UDP-N-acetylmuramoylalanine--D-glutamate ligase [Bacteroidetes bacterium ADurb.Bin174]|nr:MAG: UDP-N-acetylmuramoylalanine--D-glutamate ligase [Bacteroidetes bacterium ADurb.Bin174]
MNKQNKHIAILGAGESGTGAAVLAKKQGFDVFVSDNSTIKAPYKSLLNQHKIQWEENQHTEAKILQADEIIISPGIPNTAPIVVKATEKNIPIISEIEFAGRFTDAKMICITGSNGKTTTTSLIYHILKTAGLDVGLAGNIGHSLALQVALEPHAYYVIELSSFQLDYMFDFKADVAVLLNITPDHLDRYNFDFQSYINSKFRIIRNQTKRDAFVFWEDDPIIQKELAKRTVKASVYPFALKKTNSSQAFTENKEIIFNTDHIQFTMAIRELTIKGVHNTYNSMAAGLAAAVLDLKKETIRQSLIDFKGVEHRLEYVATVRNVQFINDSKATNVNSCWYALKSFETPIVLILGGKDKGNDYTEIQSLVKNQVRALVFLGVDNAPLHRAFDKSGKQIVETQSMKDAVQQAYQLAQEGDTVLLSPCCASFDLFESYEDRGKQFKKYVREL